MNTDYKAADKAVVISKTFRLSFFLCNVSSFWSKMRSFANVLSEEFSKSETPSNLQDLNFTLLDFLANSISKIKDTMEIIVIEG